MYSIASSKGAVKETILGIEIDDPWRGLETLDSEETGAYITSQNELSTSILHSHPGRKSLELMVAKEYDRPRASCPTLQGDGYYYWLHNDGTWAHDVMLRSKSLEAFGMNPGPAPAPESFFNVNEEPFTSLYAYTWSACGAFFCAVLQKSGSDWQRIRIIDCRTKAPIEPDLTNSKFTFGACFIDTSGVLYKAPVIRSEPNGSASDGRYGIWYHHIGTAQTSDVLLWQPEESETTLMPSRFEICSFDPRPSSKARKWLFFSLVTSTNPDVESYLVELTNDLNEPSQQIGTQLVELLKARKYLAKGFSGKHTYLGTLSNGNHLFFSTTNGATRGRILQLSQSTIDSTPVGGVLSLEEVVPENSAGLLATGANLIGDSVIVITNLQDACAKVVFVDAWNGKLLGQSDWNGTFGDVRTTADIDLPVPDTEVPNSVPGSHSTVFPAHCTVTKVSSRPDSPDFFITVDTFVAPPYVLAGSVVERSGESEVVISRLDDTHADKTLTCKQEFYSSFDGQKIPIFICHEQSVGITTPRPLLLYAYGGYGVSSTPKYDPFFRTFIRHLGGIVAIACIRGGGEYGKQWHRCATGVNRHICFEDFCYAAIYLQAQRITTPGLTATFGTSNGGLLMAATVNRHPELFAAVVVDAGVLDLTRFHLFTLGRLWVSEFGSPEDPDELVAIHNNSPYHNVNPNEQVVYPAILVATGDNDTRVPPGNSLKYLAQLQTIRASNPNLSLGRIYPNAGHEMSSKSVAQKVEILVDRLVFYAVTMKLSLRTVGL